MDAPRVMPFYKRRISSESSGHSELKFTEDKRSKTMKQMRPHRAGHETGLKASRNLREPLLSQQILYSDSKSPSGAYINVKINSIKIDEQEYYVNFTTIVKSLPRNENTLVPVVEFMNEYTDETFKQSKIQMTPDRVNQNESKVSFWQRLNLFNKS